MNWKSALAIYVLFWALSVFFVLPFGVRTSQEAGAELVPGQAESAPHSFDAKRTALRVTIVASVMLCWIRSSRAFASGNSNQQALVADEML